jgi:hypothetical protein
MDLASQEIMLVLLNLALKDLLSSLLPNLTGILKLELSVKMLEELN